MLLQNASKYSSKESIASNKTAEELESQSSEKIEAVRDLYSTYFHPMKCSYRTNSKRVTLKTNSVTLLREREFGFVNFSRCANARHKTIDRLLPNKGEVIASMARPTFCGQFSEDGQRFFSACQDQNIRLYDTSNSRTFKNLTEIPVDDVGWSILDTALSPDRNSVAYSTWSESIYLVTLDENTNRQRIIPLYLQPDNHSFSIFSLQYSDDGSEIIGGSNDTHVYIYDLNKQKRTLRVRAHEDDINSVRFIDNSNSLIVSGSDDNLISVWDRRALNESQPKPVGVFAGHVNGITFIHSRMDTRYLISNSKDQSIKLWDMRRFANESTIEASRKLANHFNNDWDYRYDIFERQPNNCYILGDPSIRTYRGHSVTYTLIRCYFSPAFTTGQKYIITGSSNGSVQIYDVLTGEIRLTLSASNNPQENREKCIRDVSWHPYENYIISTSWDYRRSHVRWTYSSDEITDSKLISLHTADSPIRPQLYALSGSMLERLMQNNYNFDFDLDEYTDESLEEQE